LLKEDALLVKGEYTGKRNETGIRKIENPKYNRGDTRVGEGKVGD
jgi:hypothetical protein